MTNPATREGHEPAIPGDLGQDLQVDTYATGALATPGSHPASHEKHPRPISRTNATASRKSASSLRHGILTRLKKSDSTESQFACGKLSPEVN
ncbi:MAG TPA: hypothetical protein VFV66_27960 [Nonomuraea sp.]|nr:hypothetical protein [Nonomuraea sp.]